MIHKKKIVALAALFATGASLLGMSTFALPAHAQTVSASVSVKDSQNASKIIARSDAAITDRINKLNDLSNRVAGAKNISATVKANIAATIQTNISGLTALKAKIDADTDMTTLRADAKTITGDYRVYALVAPQSSIIAAADRVDTITGMMTTIGTKLQTRITAAQSAGHDTSALQASLSDLNAKIADANTQAASATSGVSSLVPDEGNQTQLQSNTAALKAARADLQTATSDLKTARQDAQSIITGLKAFGPVTTSTPTPAQ